MELVITYINIVTILSLKDTFFRSFLSLEDMECQILTQLALLMIQRFSKMVGGELSESYQRGCQI